ncbi:MAG: FAD-binding oxidoreductase [Gammaproteobacteria bacterium]
MISLEFIKALKQHLDGTSIYTDPSDCWAYGSDNSRRHALPDAVVLPTTSDEIEKLVKLCLEFRVPLIARGRASGTTGGVVPIHGGVIVSLERMTKIIQFDPADRWIQVEAGVLNSDVQKIAATEKLFWAPDPSSRDYCTIGGNIACCAAGPRAVKYGTVRENTLGLTAVLGTGETIHTGIFTNKGVVGYDLTRLLIGSEGTLGIVTSATLKLMPLPTESRILRAFYRSLEGAASAVTQMMRQSITPSALEFIDRNCLNLIRQYTDPNIPSEAHAMLMFEADGDKEDINYQINILKKAAHTQDLVLLEVAETLEQAEVFWKTRKSLSPTLRKLSPHKINEDVVVPISKMPEFINHIDILSKKYEFTIVNFGHAGNGNIHVNILADPNDPVIGPKAKACLTEVFDYVLSLKGTLSGEHGVGLEKRDYVAKEIDPITLNLMKRIKSQFDPKGILNPGKLFPN